jgi:hypothetical protein
VLLAEDGISRLNNMQVARLRRGALARLAPFMAGREWAVPVSYGRTPDPRFSPWFSALSANERARLWDQAVTRALGLIAVGPVEARRRQRLHAELFRYLASARQTTPTSPTARAGPGDRGDVCGAVARVVGSGFIR